MKKFNKVSTIILSIAFMLNIAGPTATFAATDPVLGASSTFSIVAQTAITGTGTISGNVGLNSTGAGITALTAGMVSGTIYSSDGVATLGAPPASTTIMSATVQANLSTANGNISSQGSTASIGPALDGETRTTGVYDIGAGRLNGGVLTLNGPGIYIFRASSDFVSSGSINLTNGARACDVYWQVNTLATINGSSFVGTIIAGTGVHFGADVALDGRALALGGDVTLLNNTISGPTCVPAPQLTVTKTIVNTGGGVKITSDFPLFIDGGSVTSGVANTTTAGLHTVSETTDPSYSSLIGGDCASTGTITLVAGDVKTCTITNTYIPPTPTTATLHVVKTVINNNGGTAVASAFTINVTGTNVSNPSFAGSASGVDVTLNAGSYAVTEPVVPTGYLQTGSGDCSGTIVAGETKTCTITNDDIAPQLIVNKVVVNDNGGTKVISNFSLFIDSVSVTSGITSTTTVGLHTVSETSDTGYTTTIGGNCAANGTITLALGDVKTCTITNDDIASVTSGGSAPVPPLIDVVKVPSPLALPDGPGKVKYTYTLRNIGTVPVTDITMVGDTCRPIILISGDKNADAKLDVNETWIHTCSTTLTKTHTNIVTATGWANGLSTTDIASATVIVGIPVVPPLIHVTKIPSSLVLSVGGGTVTYTNKVTNPGTVALSNVLLTDDKCKPVKYISGDKNNDSKLDTTETWVYTCQANLTKTKVNTVTASGEANGLIAKDFAIVTVVVNAAVPQLPNTGIPPSEDNIPWNIIVTTGIFTILAFFLIARRKQIA